MFFAVMLVIALYKLYKLYNRRIAFYYEVLQSVQISENVSVLLCRVPFPIVDGRGQHDQTTRGTFAISINPLRLV